MSSSARYRQAIRILTKKYSLALKGDAAKYLQDEVLALLIDQDENEFSDTIDYFATAFIQHQGEETEGSRGLFVERDSLETVVNNVLRKRAITGSAVDNQDAEMDEDMAANLGAYLHVIDAFKIPKWSYLVDSKNFVLSRDTPEVLGSADSKALMHRDRYELIKQRLLRNEQFRPSSITAGRKGKHYDITLIKNLNGRPPGDYTLFGMLTQIREGKHCLEDSDSQIELDFPPHLILARGLFTHNCFVVAFGTYTEKKTFSVTHLAMPPPESRQLTISTFGYNADFFGSPQETDDPETLLQIEKGMNTAALVFISDIWLDQPTVMRKLRLLFEGYSASVCPLAFVLIGNFSSKPFLYNTANTEAFIESFAALANLINEFPDLNAKSKFIFVPGPADPLAGDLLPQRPLPETFMRRMKERVPNAILATNPCRIKYCTQEVIVFRQDLISKMRRNAIIYPNLEAEPEIRKHLVQTIIDQSHLTPLPVEVRPVYWRYDHALRLYPIPHLLVLADQHDGYKLAYEGCNVLNPGPFGSKGEFVTYFPSDQSHEFNAI
ncbi:DNA polymerase alpha/epsilon subunit B-domain-containing protein [Zopfochytrium polystomum]|nr:DNA polymerase alpha/epsilon subunit B-domain-containing protein [Zopfochytrium polystomum]